MGTKINLENIHQLKLETLRRKIGIGIEQLENGQYTEHDEKSLEAFCDGIKARGRQNKKFY